jgi:PAS domain S-box-containing protein
MKPSSLIQELSEHIFNLTNDAIFIMAIEQGEKYKCVSVNETYLKHTKLKPDEVIGKYVQEILPEKDLNTAVRGYKKAIQTRQPAQYIEMVDFGFGLDIVETTIMPVFDNSGRCNYLIGASRDIKQQVQTRDQLDLMIRTLESVNEAVSITDENNNIIYTNRAFHKLYKYSENELSGKNIAIVRAADTTPSLEEISQKTITGGWQGELINVSRDGNKFPIRLSSSPIINPDGNIIAMVGIAEDISAQRVINDKLKSHELWIESITENSPHIIYVYNVAEQRNIYYNRSLLEHLGYAKDELDEYSENFFQQITHPDDLPQYDYFFDTIENWETGQIFSFEYRLKNKAGQWRWFKGSEREFERRDGKVISMIGTVEDINEIKEAREAIEKSEEQYRLLADNASDAIAMYNHKFELIYLSPANEKLSGYSLEELVELPFLEIVYPPDREKLSNDISHAIENLITEDSLVYRFVRKNGQIVWVETNSKRMFDEAGNLQRIITVNRDITLRKQAEAVLEERNEKFRFLSRSMAEMLEMKDVPAIYDYITEKLARQYPKTIMLTVTVDEDKGETKLTHVKGIEQHMLSKIFNMTGYNLIGKKFQLKPLHRRIFQSGDFKEFEGGLADFASTEFPAYLSKTLQQLLGIKKIYTIGINSREKLLAATHFFTLDDQPIEDKDYIETFLKQAGIVIQHKLNEEKLRFQSLILDQIYDMVTVTDLKGNINYVNDSLVKTSGLKREQLYGKKIFSKIVDEKPEQKRDEILTTALEKGNWRGEITNMDAAGNEVLLDLRMQPVRDPAGRAIAICGISTDVTHQRKQEKLVKESELRYQNLFNSMTEGFSISRIITDDAYNPVDWEFMIVNKAHEKHTGLKPSDIIGKRALQIYPDIETYWLDFYGKIALTGNSGTIEAFNKNTGKYYRVNAFCPASGQFAAVVTDITDTKLTQQKLIEAKEKAIAADKLKTEFLNKISHEVRTPLNGILGFSEMYFQEDTTPEEKAEYLSILHESSDRLMQTINDYMDISLLSSGTQEVNLRKITIAEVVGNLENIYQDKCKNKSLHFRVDLSPILSDELIETDEELLSKALHHLLDNAIKFTTKGEITFGCNKTTEGICFSVTDTGVGISENMVEKVFDNFIQEDNSATRNYEGSGLGLAIVKKIAGLLHHNLDVHSIKGKGTTMAITVPLKSDIEAEEIAEIPHQSFGSYSEPTIVIAEDDLYSLMLLQAVFKPYDVKILSAKTGKQAVEMADKNPEISLILMDIKMPELSGIEATKIIRERHPHIKIIAQTAFALSGDAQKAAEAGCDDYIAKPIRKNQLFEKMEKCGVILKLKSN